MDSEDRAATATHVVVAILLGLGFFWLRDDIHFWLDGIATFGSEKLFSINSLGWFLIAAAPLLALNLIVTLLGVANFLYLF